MTNGAVEKVEHELDPVLQAELLEHAGRWVATTSEEIIAVGDSAKEVYKAAIDAGVDMPVVFRVPEAGESYLL